VQELYLDDVASMGAKMGFSPEVCKKAAMICRATAAAAAGTDAKGKGGSKEREERALKDRQQPLRELAVEAIVALVQPASCVLVRDAPRARRGEIGCES
jgi:hypothetical protein